MNNWILNNYLKKTMIALLMILTVALNIIKAKNKFKTKI